jgi:hypothetical protein
MDSVDRAVVGLAAKIWKADEINGQIHDTDTLLLLFDPLHTTPPAFIETLTRASTLGVPVGVIPVFPGDDPQTLLTRLLGNDRLEVDFSYSRFHLSDSPQVPGIPPVLSRADQGSPQVVDDDIEQADLLFLQGHSGPMDGSFGRWLTLCSRGLHTAGTPALYPCAGTERCFRQSSQGRADTSRDGLIDPRRLKSSLVVVDGCGTFPVPGSLYPYEQSILRGLMLSQVRASVLSVGISATPFSAIVLFLALLARGNTLGQAILQANLHRRDMGSPASIEGIAAAPWLLVGNPAAVITGIPMLECAAERMSDTSVQFLLPADHVSASTGTLVSVKYPSAIEGPLDVACYPRAWAHGAMHQEHAYLWLGSSVDGDTTEATRVVLSARPGAGSEVWRACFFWLNAGTQWLSGMAQALARREQDNSALLAIIAFREELAVSAEQAAYADTPYRELEIAAGLDAATAHLVLVLGQVDRLTATAVAESIRFAGARLAHLWSPPWLHSGYAQVDQRCLCGCAMVGHVRRHPLHDLLRIELSCPTCSLIGDAAAEFDGTSGGAAPRAMLKASMRQRSLVCGQPIQWTVEANAQDRFEGFACATLFDPFRTRQAVSQTLQIGTACATTVELDVPYDWPAGLAWATLIFTAGGRVCLFAFDVEVQATPARRIPLIA